MKFKSKLALAGATVVAAAVPGIALADGAHQSAQQQCRQEQASMGTQTFAQTYGTNKNRRNAFGKCVSRRTRQNDSDETNAQGNAAQRCRTEQQSDPATFKTRYGTNGNGHNAFGKCLSTTAGNDAQSQEAQQVRAEDNAAKQCRAERKNDPAAFKAKYGSNQNRRDAFGKCVSATAKTHESSSSS